MLAQRHGGSPEIHLTHAALGFGGQKETGVRVRRTVLGKPSVSVYFTLSAPERKVAVSPCREGQGSWPCVPPRVWAGTRTQGHESPEPALPAAKAPGGARGWDCGPPVVKPEAQAGSVLGDQGRDHAREGVVAALGRWDQLHHLRVDVLPPEARFQQGWHLCLLAAGETGQVTASHQATRDPHGTHSSWHSVCNCQGPREGAQSGGGISRGLDSGSSFLLSWGASRCLLRIL